MAKPFLAALTCALVLLPRGVRGAALPKNNTDFDGPSVSLGTPYSYHLSSSASRPSVPSSSTSSKKASSSSSPSSLSAPNTRRQSASSPPGADSDPEGLTIYDTLSAVPTARLLWRAKRLAKCYPAQRTPFTPSSSSSSSSSSMRHQQRQQLKQDDCWTAYMCGHRCEPVLLAVRSYCRLDDYADGTPRWRRCSKARKFNRCFARVCFRRTGNPVGPRPSSYEDPLSVAIVRYTRPLPKYELLARKKQQSSTQSAIFK